MKAKSCYSISIDPYRAGIEIGESLLELKPEVIFLFSTIHFGDSSELLEGIYDVLNDDDLIIIGNSGDGFYEQNKVGDIGVSALGINSENAINWHINYSKKIGENPYDATKKCIMDLNKHFGAVEPSLYFLASDFRTDTTEVIKALREFALGPVVGGLAGDDDAIQSCFVYANAEVLTDCIVILAMEGKFSFDISIAHNLQPMGNIGIITDNNATIVNSIDNIPAMDFLERELGKPIDEMNRGNITFKIIEEKHEKEHKIRSIFLTDNDLNDKSVRLLGGVEKGNRAQVCLAPPEKVLQDVKDISSDIKNLDFNPKVALIISCAGRKRVLSGKIENEVKDIVSASTHLQAVAGYPSFGEFGPVKNGNGYSDPLFHNMTFILLLLGD